MKDKPICPFWNEKKGECKVLDILLDLTEVSKRLAETIEAYTPQKTSLGPVPGSHGQIEGHSPIQMASVQAPPLPPFLSFLKGPPDKKKLYREQEEESKKKQEYWEKELKKMDEEKGK